MILKHENTRPVKEDDRTRHVLEQRAHAEPVMLTYRGDDAIDAAVAAAMEAEPLYDFRAKDYVQHTVWALPNPEAVAAAFGGVDVLYVADYSNNCVRAVSRSGFVSTLAKEVSPSR